MSVRAILVGCVKTKLGHVAPAEDLYASPLFRRRRDFAESSGKPWFILSARHGLLRPADVIAPYDMAMADQSREYKRAWAEWVVQHLVLELGQLNGACFEVHAGSHYVEPLTEVLRPFSATVLAPLRGLRQGGHLAWYVAHDAKPLDAETPALDLVRALSDPAALRPAVDFPWGRGSEFSAAGLYSWWVDKDGAAALASGLGMTVLPGLIYAGQTGATAWPSGKRSSSTLINRVGSNHLRGRVSISTFRQTLASVLCGPAGWPSSESSFGPSAEARLTAWMHAHLSLIAVPVVDRDGLEALEAAVLERLDPPLNLMGFDPRSSLRSALSALRREFGR